MKRDLLDRVIAALTALRDGTPAGREPSLPPLPDSVPHVDRIRWLQELLALSPDAVCVLALDGTIQYINRAPGMDPSTLVGRAAEEFLCAESHQAWADAVSAATQGMSPPPQVVKSISGRYWQMHVVPIKEGSRVAWLLSIARDVSAEQEALHALELNHEQTKLALRASGMGQWSWDVVSDRVIWDDVTRRILDWPADDDNLTLQSFLDRIHRDDIGRVQHAIKLAMQNKQDHHVQCRVVLPDGRVRWIVSQGRALCDAKGEIHTVIGGVMDLTSGRRTDEQLQRSAKLEAIGQLAGGIAHDFNNLLVAILGNLDLAKDETDPVKLKECLQDATEASNRAAELTRQLLVFSRKQPLTDATVDCQALVSDTVSMLRRLIPENITLKREGEGHLPTVFGDRGQLEQVLVNACVNARDAMPNGGQLTIATQAVELDERLRQTHPWTRAGRHVRITVTDTGVGIAPGERDHIFEPFYTTKTTGTGLGLATAYAIVKQHRGLIDVRSTPNEGTILSVFLPVADEKRASERSKADEPIRGGHETVLLAEDEVAVRSVVTRMLKRAGYQVIAASDGQQALELFRQHQHEVKLLVLDAVMPRKGGTEALQEIRQLDPSIPALLCSGYSEAPEGPWRALDGDAVDFMAKPYEPDALLRTIRRLLDSRTCP